MAALSVDVTAKVRSCLYVLAAFLTEGPSIANSLTGLTQPHINQEDEAPGFSSVLTGLYQALKASLQRLVDADSRVAVAVARESLLRKQYLDLSKKAGQMIIALRRTVQGQFIEPNMPNLGLETLDAQDSITVMRRILLIVERFTSVDLLGLLGPSRFSKAVDLNDYVEEIQEAGTGLLELTDQINEARRQTSKARVERNRIMKEHENVFLRSARIFEDFCRYVGEDELADRLRPSTTRRGRTAVEPDEVPGEVIARIGDLDPALAKGVIPQAEETRVEETQVEETQV